MIGLYRVRENDTLSLRVVSSVATTLRATFIVHYDNGQDDILNVAEKVLAGTRTVETFVSDDNCKHAGYVVGGGATVSVTATKRGQVYMDASMTQGLAYSILCKGYVYDGHALALGQFVEPGPGGGEGAVRHIAVAATALGAAGIKTLQTVPTNAIWKVHYARFSYVASATAGTRNVIVDVLRTTNPTRTTVERTATAGQRVEHIWVEGEPAGTANFFAATASVVGTTPDWLVEGDVIRIDDTADIDVADTVAETYQVEEWLVI